MLRSTTEPRSQTRQQPGQALIEVALMATLLFLLLAAAIDLGLIFLNLQGLHNAAQEGATFGSRWLVVATDSSGVTSTQLNITEIRRRVSGEAGATAARLANPLDLNADGAPDVVYANTNGNGGRDTYQILGADGAISTTSVAAGSAAPANSVLAQYVTAIALWDLNNDGDPTNDTGADGNLAICPNLASPLVNCYIQVRIRADYRPFFPLAPALGVSVPLASTFTMPLRGGFEQAGGT